MTEIQATVTQNLQSAARQQAKYYNMKRRNISYKVGDKVYVDARFLPMGQPHKFANRREGPFQIVGELNKNSYVVRVPSRGTDRYRDMHLSVEKLTPYREDNRWQLDPGLVRRQPQREVAWIRSHQDLEGRTRKFLVRYKGHHPGLDEWVLARDIPRKMLRAYLERRGLSLPVSSSSSSSE
jgi:ribosomal protein L21E